MQRNTENIELYRDFCKRVDVPFFANDYWLDVVCPEEWDVFIVKKEDRVVAAMPYHEVHRFGFRFMLQPKFTPYLGPQIDYSGIKNDEYSRRSFFRECVEDILKMIESKKFAYQQISMHRSEMDWLPFYWKGYSSTIKYTYVIDDFSDYDSIKKSYHISKRKHLKRTDKFGICACPYLSPEEFYDFHNRYIENRGGHLSYNFSMFNDIYKNISDRGQCKLIGVSGKDGILQSAAFVVWDNNSAYLLMTCTDQEYKSTGASTLVVDEAIRYCLGRTKCFDFEGSMIHNVENSCSKYGSSQKPYIFLERYSSLAMEFLLRASGKVK